MTTYLSEVVPLSLWLFEHVHGESRDRGQAMVDLMAQYDMAGFEVNAKNCLTIYRCIWNFYPTKPPSNHDEMQIREESANISHIVTLLAARLMDKTATMLVYLKHCCKSQVNHWCH